MELERIKSALKHNDQAFVELIKEKKEKLTKIAYRYYLNDAAVEDVLSETIYQTYRNRKKCKHPEFFDTWIIRILINECLKELKKNNFNELMVDVADQEIHDPLLKSMVYDMDEPDRSIIILHFFEGYTLDEIASILKLPSSTLKSKYYKILDDLKHELKGDFTYESK